MRKLIAPWFASFVVYSVLDYFWHSTLLVDFYNDKLSGIARFSGDAVRPNMAVALLAGLVVTGGLTFLVHSLYNRQHPRRSAVKLGAMLGFLILGSASFMNAGLIQNWTFDLTVIELIWSALIGAISAVVIVYVAAWQKQGAKASK